MNNEIICEIVKSVKLSHRCYVPALDIKGSIGELYVAQK